MAELPGLELPRARQETERTMLDRLRARYGRTYQNGSYRGRQYVIAEKVATTPGAWGGTASRMRSCWTRGRPRTMT
ncbi:beta/gamma crystallin family protein [Microbacterium sp. NIBRBAC000506063]|uniref:beta/gamma crystallin family protein n=1 Tax=Microbacterium sp. NIBRBAC000506063 TaxID=2734618 RepID=UPI001BB7E4C3|nr:beta/gamma crystallin family protein [Microbacterium sp. NIBRBAC000506063]QTV79467.1 hypothetical protein KAE78_11225 [Microbacterium sp. NIBRBAC000506063]